MGPDFYQVELIGNGFLAVMAKPVVGEWLDDDIGALAEAGIRRVLSLLERSEQDELGLAEEAELCAKHGIEFMSFPIKDRGLPRSVSEFSKFTKSLYHSIAGGDSTVIHCRAGIGRTGIVAAGVLIHAAFEADEAFAHISKARGVDVPDTQEQYDFIKANQVSIARGK